jgi:hypothetical protein
MVQSEVFYLFTLYLAYPDVTVTPYVKSTLQETEKVNDFGHLMVHSRATFEYCGRGEGAWLLSHVAVVCNVLK